MMQSDFDFGCW